jgi:hypothetical protein
MFFLCVLYHKKTKNTKSPGHLTWYHIRTCRPSGSHAYCDQTEAFGALEAHILVGQPPTSD